MASAILIAVPVVLVAGLVAIMTARSRREQKRQVRLAVAFERSRRGQHRG